jgi:ComF family protein
VLLHALKFHGDLRAGRWLGRRLGAVLHREHLSEQVRAVVPVPLHGVRLRERGFNQSRVLAEEVASALGLPVVESVSRQRNTRSQALLPREERLTNVHGAFTVGSPQENAPVLLVDDVLTTGATLAACAAALGTAGAGAVVAATVALAES